MSHSARIPSRWRYGLVGAILSALVGTLLLTTQLGDPLARLSYDSLYAVRPDVPVDGVMIVQMDEDSHRILGQPGTGPWDRALHAQLIERMTMWGAKAIVFDVLFLGERDPGGDARLVSAAKASDRVVVAAQMKPELSGGQVIGWTLTRPFAALANVASVGVVEEAGEDRAVRQHYWNPQFTNAPSLTWEAARVVTGRVPQAPADRWVTYYGPPGWIPRVSYYHVLETNTDPILGTTFSNKVVFVGAGYTVGFTAGKGSDEFRTPYTRWTGRLSPGVEIVATTYLNLVRGDWLVRLRPKVECAVILFTGLALGLGMAACRASRAWIIAFGVIVIIAAGVYALAWRYHVWFPWLIIVAVQVPITLAWSAVANNYRLHRDNRSLEQRLALLAAAEAATGNVPGRSQALADRVAGALRNEMEPTVAAAEAEQPTIPDQELLRRIGQGAYGEVWLARDILDIYHAVKIVHRRRFRDGRPLEREFEGLKRYTPISRSHPNLVQILHVGQGADREWIYYVMEASDDENAANSVIDPRTYSPRTLASALRQRRRLPLPECLALSIDLASALDFLHQHRLVHRDIKPSNIIFVNGVPKLADIGLITAAETGGDAAPLGTPGYIPPEGPGTTAADVYSLGKAIYEAAFGLDCTRFPDLPRAIIEHADEGGLFDLNRILLKACENDPARRYSSAQELRRDLVVLQESLGMVRLS